MAPQVIVPKVALPRSVVDGNTVFLTLKLHLKMALTFCTLQGVRAVGTASLCFKISCAVVVGRLSSD